MSTASVLGWTTAAILGLVGIGYAVAGTSPATKGGGASAYKKTTTIHPGDRVRLSVAKKDLDTLAQALGMTQSEQTAWEAVLMSAQFNAVLQPEANNRVAWMPGDKLPDDWPADDPAPRAEYHAEFIYGGTSDVQTSQIPFPALVWTIPKTAPPVPAPQAQADSAKKLDQWLDFDHTSTIVSRGIAITTIGAKANYGALALYVFPQSGTRSVAVHPDWGATEATQGAIGFLASLPPAGEALGDPDVRVEIGANFGHVTQAQGVELVTVPVGQAGTTAILAWLAVYVLQSGGQSYLVGLTAPTEAQAQVLASSAIAVWKQQNG